MSTLMTDPLPPSLATYYAALDDGRMTDAAAAFAPDACFAGPAPAVIETDPRVLSVGRAAIRARFEGRGPRTDVHDILVCVHDARSCLLEGVSRDGTDGTALASFVASAQLDGAGLVTRYLAFATTSVIAPYEAPADSSVDALALLDRYFHALDAGDFDAAAACFSDDTLYSHPPYKHTGLDGFERVEFVGRAHLLEAFRARGQASFDHRIVAGMQRGPHALVEGLVENLPASSTHRTGSFISNLTLDDQGLIRRYATFYCEPSVPRA